MSSASFNRPGCGRPLRSQAEGPAAGRRPRAAGGAGRGSYVVEVTEQTFEAETIRRSVKHPVVVELYSPRVATGQQLSDALIDIANSSDGKFLLARLNVDTAPGIVQALGLQAVPTVIALINGQVAPLFQGVLPREQVQAAIDQLLKAAVANGIVGRADPVGGATPDEDPAEEPVADPRFAAADEALARGDFAAAEAEFDKLLAANPGDAEAQAGKAQAGLFARATRYDPQVVLAGRPRRRRRRGPAGRRRRGDGQWSGRGRVRPADRPDQDARPATSGTRSGCGCWSCSRRSATPTRGCSRRAGT